MPELINSPDGRPDRFNPFSMDQILPELINLKDMSFKTTAFTWITEEDRAANDSRSVCALMVRNGPNDRSLDLLAIVPCGMRNGAAAFSWSGGKKPDRAAWTASEQKIPIQSKTG